jgi:hypothetical protein
LNTHDTDRHFAVPLPNFVIHTFRKVI